MIRRIPRATAIALPRDAIELRFKFETDGCTGSFGWYVDDLLVYRCHASRPGRGARARAPSREAR